MANKHTTLTSLFDNIAGAIRDTSVVTEDIKADAFPAYILMQNFTGTLSATPSVLNSCSWEFIRWASDQGIADLLWSVGDRKGVTLTAFGATNTTYQYAAGTYYCYILGFNHNASLEGSNLIHFQFGFSALTGGVHIALTAADYGLNWGSDTTSPYYGRMNPTATTSGGWKDSWMRTKFLTQNSNRTFRTAVPSDLAAVVKTVTKYTDNVGDGTDTASNVTATTDTFFLLSSGEYGFINGVNTTELSKTAQYQYYKNGNPKLFYCSHATSSTAESWERSPNVQSAGSFLTTHTNGTQNRAATANGVYGVSPAFCV